MTALTADCIIIAGLQRARDRDPRDDRDRESVLEAQAGRGGVRVPQGHRLLRPQLEGAEGGGEDSQAEAADTGRGIKRILHRKLKYFRYCLKDVLAYYQEVPFFQLLLIPCLHFFLNKHNMQVM